MNKILFITLEFSAATFSGNGVYAQSQVRSLSQQPETHVLVLSGKPLGHSFASHKRGAKHLVEVELARWGSLDSSAPWEEFASKVGSRDIQQLVSDFDPTVCLFVDWSSWPAWQAVKQGLRPKVIPSIFLNYRVFSRTELGEAKQLVQKLEADAMKQSSVTVVLSASDRDYLLKHVARPASAKHRPPPCQVLLCALREELNSLPVPLDLGLEAGQGMLGPGFCQGQGMIHGPNSAAGGRGASNTGLETENQSHKMHPVDCLSAGSASSLPSWTAVEHQPPVQVKTTSAAAQQFQAGRPYLTCCVRLAREKEPERFVALVEHLAQDGTLEQHQLTPLLVGATNDAYAQDIKQRLRRVAPSSVIIERFLGPQELAIEVFSRTRLNVHPCTYDAFGMTIVEAASMGAPSIVHSHPGAVGATDLLQADTAEVILEDVTDVHVLAVSVSALLHDGEKLLQVARRAASRARSWTEAKNAQKLLEMTERATRR